MKKQLFFDDMKLLRRENLRRAYGTPECIAVYSDGISSTDYPEIFVFRLDNGKYRMIYAGKSVDGSYQHLKMFSAISDDGINFVPEKLWDNPEAQGLTYQHEVMNIGNAEIGFIYEDNHCDKSERYKLLMFDAVFDDFDFHNDIYTSPDLLNWTKNGTVQWADEAEPLVSVFYNKHKGCHTLMERPYWGTRRLGFKETTDWKTLTPWKNCMNVDSEDDILSELYGMFAFEYDGMYIGVPHLYRKHQPQRNAKYHDGIVDTQLAISYDGECWNRSLRTPFIGYGKKVLKGREYEKNLIWIFSIQRADNGDILLYTAESELEHGPAFRNPGSGRIFVYKLRGDGFISLSSEDNEKESVLATREKIWNGGELSVNLRAEGATLAVFYADDYNTLAFNKPYPGMTHEDCIEFSGDSTAWTPKYKSGKSFEELYGKTVIFELKMRSGEVFSIFGDFTDIYNTQAARYRRWGTMPTI